MEPFPVTVQAPAFGAPARERSEFLVAYDDEYLYVAGRLYDSQPSRIQAASLRRNAGQSDNDLFGAKQVVILGNERGMLRGVVMQSLIEAMPSDADRPLGQARAQKILKAVRLTTLQHCRGIEVEHLLVFGAGAQPALGARSHAAQEQRVEARGIEPVEGRAADLANRAPDFGRIFADEVVDKERNIRRTMRERLDRLDEACHVMKSLWTERRSTFKGRFYQLSDAPLDPKPVQAPHPELMIGGVGEKVTLRIVAKHADRWNMWGGPKTAAQRGAVLDAHCAAVGRDPKTGRRVQVMKGGFTTEREALDDPEGAGKEILAYLRARPQAIDRPLMLAHLKELAQKIKAKESTDEQASDD